jgi:DNA-binding Lrp family transcriptional regulator
MAETKQKQSPSLRTPGVKKKLGLSVPPPLRMPHEDLVKRISQETELDLTSQETKTSLDSKTSLPLQSSLGSKTSLDSDQAGAWSQTSLDNQTRQPSKTSQSKTRVDLMSSLPDVKGYLRLHFQILDHLYPQLDPFERAVHETLYRLTWGFSRETCTISYQRIAERTNMSPKSAQRAVGKLEGKGLIRKVGQVIGYQKEQGIEFSVVPAPRLALESRQVTQSRLVRETDMIDSVLQTNNTQTQVGVSVGSRFSLEECRRFADHLKATNQGITNPGGYATKIFRSGEADELIEAFMNPPVKIDPNQCPDCSGSNFIYIDPSNRDRGVKPCKHERLKQG